MQCNAQWCFLLFVPRISQQSVRIKFTSLGCMDVCLSLCCPSVLLFVESDLIPEWVALWVYNNNYTCGVTERKSTRGPNLCLISVPGPLSFPRRDFCVRRSQHFLRLCNARAVCCNNNTRVCG